MSETALVKGKISSTSLEQYQHKKYKGNIYYYYGYLYRANSSWSHKSATLAMNLSTVCRLTRQLNKNGKLEVSSPMVYRKQQPASMTTLTT